MSADCWEVETLPLARLVTCLFSKLPKILYPERPNPPKEKPSFPFLADPWRPKLDPLHPAAELILSVIPCRLFFLVTMLITPEVPSASNLADGEVITSTALISSAGICRKASAMEEAAIAEGLLSIKTRILELPLIDTLPFKSTDSMGTRRSTSVASPPAVVLSFSAL